MVGALVKQHRSLRKMIPSFSVPSGVSLPNAVPIPNIPYSLPNFNTPRWVPIVTPLEKPAMMQEPKVAPPQEEVIEEKPATKPQSKPEPQVAPGPQSQPDSTIPFNQIGCEKQKQYCAILSLPMFQYLR